MLHAKHVRINRSDGKGAHERCLVFTFGEYSLFADAGGGANLREMIVE